MTDTNKKKSQVFAGTPQQTPKGSVVIAERNTPAKNVGEDTYDYTVSLIGTELITDLGRISGEVSAFFNGLVTGKVISMIDEHLSLSGLTRDTNKTAGVRSFAERMRGLDGISEIMQGIGSVTIYDHKGKEHLYGINIGRQLVENAL